MGIHVETETVTRYVVTLDGDDVAHLQSACLMANLYMESKSFLIPKPGYSAFLDRISQLLDKVSEDE